MKKMRRIKNKLEKFLNKYISKKLKVYWYYLDPEMGLLREKLGIHLFGYGFEISLVWWNFILTWQKE